MTRFLPALALMAAALPAYAEPATPEEAARLQAVFERYLGTIQGTVSVAPRDESYVLTLDAAPLIAMIPPGEGIRAEVTPLVMDLTPQGSGKWQVESDTAFSLEFVAEGIFELAFSVESADFAGIWDESLMGLASSEIHATGLHTRQWQLDPGMGETTTEHRVDTLRSVSDARPGSSGGVDTDYEMVAKGMVETISTTDPALPLALEITVGSYTNRIAGQGVRNAELLDLLAWFVARPSPEAILADQQSLKAALSDAMPFFDSIEVSSHWEALQTPTPIGRFAAEVLDFTFQMNGAVPDGYMRQRFALDGLDLPLDMVPEWAHPLLPHSMVFDFHVADFDLAATVEAFLKEVDFAIGPMPGFENRLLSLLLPEGTVTIGMGQTRATAGIYDLSMDGAMQVSMTGLPTGEASVKLDGMQAISEAVGEGPEDVTSGALPALAMLRGMARPDGDTLVWEIKGTQDGQLLVNGVDISGLIAQ